MFPFKKILIPSLLIGILVGVLVLQVPSVSAAAVVYDPVYYLKEFVIYPIVRKIANSLENKLVNKVSNQIAGISGGTANPNFITNWRNHILDSQARGNDVFRSVLADTKFCSYFGDPLKQAFGADKYVGAIAGSKVKDALGKIVYENKTNVPGLPSFQYTANCTLPSNFDVKAFQKDFKNGGWEAWDKLIEPQNNFLGAYSLALQEQQNQVAIESKASENSSIAGQGFLSQKLGSGIGVAGLGPTGCVKAGTKVSPAEMAACDQQCNANGKKICESQQSSNLIDTAKLAACLKNQQELCAYTCAEKEATTQATDRCVFQGKEVTPAQILGQSAIAAIDKKLGRVGSATQITDILIGIVGAVLDATTNRIANYVGQATYNKPPGSDTTGRLNEPTEQQIQQQEGEVGAQNSAAGQQGSQVQQQSTELQNRLPTPTPVPTL